MSQSCSSWSRKYRSRKIIRLLLIIFPQFRRNLLFFPGQQICLLGEIEIACLLPNTLQRERPLFHGPQKLQNPGIFIIAESQVGLVQLKRPRYGFSSSSSRTVWLLCSYQVR